MSNNFNLELYSKNIRSLISIYYDSEILRNAKVTELEQKLEKEIWDDIELESYTHYGLHFDWLLMNSLFISAFSYFEVFLNRIAKNFESKEISKIKIKDINGDGYLDIYRKYINLVGEIDFADKGRKEWQDITQFKQIRNFITHDYGIVSKELNKINEHNIWYGPSKKLIRIKNIEFVEDFANTSINYMSSLTREILLKYPDTF